MFKAKKPVLFFLALIFILSGCKSDSLSYEIYDTGVCYYGSSFSDKHSKEIEEKIYTSEYIEELKTYTLSGEEYKLKYEYTRSALDWSIIYDSYEDTNEKVSVGFESGTDRVVRLFYPEEKNKKGDTLLTDEKIKKAIEKYKNDNFSNYKYQKCVYKSEECVMEYYDEYDGYKLGDTLRIFANEYGYVHMVWLGYDDYYDKITEMKLRIDDKKIKDLLEKRMDIVFCGYEYRYNVTEKKLFITEENGLYLICNIDVYIDELNVEDICSYVIKLTEK